MRLAELLALVVLAGVIGFVVLRLLAAESRRTARWGISERTEADGTVVVELVKPGQHGRTVRALPPTLEGEQFEWELAQARSDAESQAAALNARR